MVKITTYKAIIFNNSSSENDHSSKPGADWLRSAFLRIVERNRKKIEETGVDISVFHNHDEKSGKNLIRYPLVIYSQKDGEFFITGINEGATSLSVFAYIVKYPVRINDHIILSFELFKESEVNLKNSRTWNSYQITDWLPLSVKEYKELDNTPAIKILALLEEKLQKHVANDLGKYLEINLDKTKVKILSFPVSSTNQVVFSFNRKFKPFSFVFSVNAELPDFLCLGYEKAIGFGRIEKI